MDRTCDACGTQFSAKRPSARFCSDRCRKRTARANPHQRGTIVPLRPEPAADIDRVSIGAAMLAEFDQRLLESSLGALAIAAAADLDTAAPGTPGKAAMIRELRGLLADLATQAAPKQANPLVLLRERRDAERRSS